MVVITLNVCPPSLRGDITRWLFEVNTGVYVGNVSARVRENLWQRVCENVKDGRATMVFTTNTEQRFDVRVHNSAWIPVDFDGLKLMMRPAAEPDPVVLPTKKHFSRAASQQIARRMSKIHGKPRQQKDEYVLLDIEATGLSEDTDEIIQICAVRIENGEQTQSYNAYVKSSIPVSPKITRLTGITNEMLAAEGVDLAVAVRQVMSIIGNATVVSHNVGFDMKFLTAACNKVSMPEPHNQTVDTLKLSRRLIKDVPNYRLSTLAAHLKIPATDAHTSHGDCEITRLLYEYLRKQSQ